MKIQCLTLPFSMFSNTEIMGLKNIMIAAIINRGHLNIIVYNIFDYGKSLYGDVQIQ